MYERVAHGEATYFVDKTPMYHLVIDEIFATFPDARFLFLFRNPLSVVASCVELFDGGRWEVARYHSALFESFAYLAPASLHYASRSLTVRFEDLVAGEETHWHRIFDYLELPWKPRLTEQFSAVELRGQKGDPTGTSAYSRLSQEPLHKWRSTLCNPIRRAWCARYLHWLGAERLAAMGYDLGELRRELATLPRCRERTVEDGRVMASSFAREFAKARLPRYSSRASTWRALLRG